MASPNTRTFTEDEEIAYDSGLVDGRIAERERIIKLIKRQVCFDALADLVSNSLRAVDSEVVGRCSHHGGKCTELLLLIETLRKGKNHG
jgi:hypothetical protein